MIDGGVEKSKFDDKNYGYINLPNQIECVLIQDPKLDKASASMNVGIGSFQDPPNIQGLAHFLEHMLFMGTSKYPSENDYSQVSLIIPFNLVSFFSWWLF
jgi:insulysin